MTGMPPFSMPYEASRDDRPGKGLDKFALELRVDVLDNILERRRTSLESLFDSAAANMNNPFSLAGDTEAINLREDMKNLFTNLENCIKDVKLSKEHLRILTNKQYDGSEPVARRLKAYTSSLFREAADKNATLTDLIEEYEALDEMELVSLDVVEHDEHEDGQHRGLPNYHESIFEDEADNIYWPAMAPPFDEATGEMEPSTVHSRRVVINNLPDGISPAQVIKGVNGFGGLLRLDVFNSTPVSGGTSTALVEFNWASCAINYANYTRTTPIFYLDVNGVKHRAKIGIVPTRSYPVDASVAALRATGSNDAPNGRCLKFHDFPMSGIWYFFERIGPSNIIGASYVKNGDPREDGDLTVEFISVFHACQARRLIVERKLKYYDLGHQRKIEATACDSDAKRRSYLWGATKGGRVVEHVPIDHLALEWDRRPWNTLWPMTVTSSMQPIRRKPVPSSVHTLKSAFFESLKFEAINFQLDDDSTRLFQGFRFTIVGNTVRINLRNSTWVIASREEIEPLMERTLHDPDWANFWDLYFTSNKQVNIRKWDEYGQLAKHRRQEAAKQGLQD
ncbi:hypothetical protein QQZ08_003601 [Neonectria magnoliae]|uniref:RRM domain-containing protein n=1 Tax=Neonectria magnoliae TaxID=2732573 RepID=A0ABR1IAE0_9HYPO